MKKRVMVVFGTRPEAVKLAPLIRALQESEHFEPVVVVTGQHREMLDQVTGLFNLTVDRDLDIMLPRQTLAEITTRSLERLDDVVRSCAPDVVVVQGDTTTTLVGALAGFYHQVPVVHVEAGLRTFDRYSPFPEEMNRKLTTSLANLHLAATAANAGNLLREGVDPESIAITGNTVIDALLWAVGRDVPYSDRALEEADSESKRILVVTAHRRESWGPGLASIARAMARLTRQHDDLLVVLPLHRNPQVQASLLPELRGVEDVLLVDPLSYGEFARLMNRADLVVTDSGGVQEEAPSLGKPVLVTRDKTERPEAIAAGTARLIGTEESAIVQAVDELLTDPVAYACMANAVNPYGDGRAAERSVAAIAHFFDLGPAPEAFDPALSFAQDGLS